MSRTNLRLLAGAVTVLIAVGTYWLQPDNLALLANPRLAAAVIGTLLIVCNLVSNWLPSMTGSTAGEDRRW